MRKLAEKCEAVWKIKSYSNVDIYPNEVEPRALNTVTVVKGDGKSIEVLIWAVGVSYNERHETTFFCPF